MIAPSRGGTLGRRKPPFFWAGRSTIKEQNSSVTLLYTRYGQTSLCVQLLSTGKYSANRVPLSPQVPPLRRHICGGEEGLGGEGDRVRRIFTIRQSGVRCVSCASVWLGATDSPIGRKR